MNGIFGKVLPNLQNGRPKNRSTTIISCIPKGFYGEIFSPKNIGKKGIFVSGNIPSGLHNLTFV
jgi:hypothetical protein